MTEELKACPLCGSKPIIACDMNEYWVLCEPCRCSGDMCGSKEEAIKEWNNRPIETALQERVDELEHLSKLGIKGGKKVDSVLKPEVQASINLMDENTALKQTLGKTIAENKVLRIEIEGRQKEAKELLARLRDAHISALLSPEKLPKKQWYHDAGVIYRVCIDAANFMEEILPTSPESKA